ERMGNATSLFNLMRNLGGGVGIATTGSVLLRQQQGYVNIFGAPGDPYSSGAQRVFGGARAPLLPRGGGRAAATPRGYAARFGTVQQQASMVSFVLLFRLLGVIFLLLLPLILLMKRPRGAASPGSAH